MNEKIRIGIIGYGNLGRGVEAAIRQNSDMELIGIFTRRKPDSVKTIDGTANVHHMDDVGSFVGKIDVMILCGGSAHDLPEQGPQLARLFNTVDSYDTHALIPQYFDSVDEVALANGRTSIISVGWDPGLFSINRLMSEAILPKGETYTFWGKGLSQGHSDAVRRVAGVKNGVQYTIPSEQAITRVRNGENPELSTSEKHERVCYVVLEDGADAKVVESEIKTMPNYFADYDTEVHFITEEQLQKEHTAMPHGGFVIRSGETGEGDNQIVEFALKLASNPQFTASVITAYARAAHRLNKEGQFGAKTVFDIAPTYISPKSAAELRKQML